MAFSASTTACLAARLTARLLDDHGPRGGRRGRTSTFERTRGTHPQRIMSINRTGRDSSDVGNCLLFHRYVQTNIFSGLDLTKNVFQAHERFVRVRHFPQETATNAGAGIFLRPNRHASWPRSACKGPYFWGREIGKFWWCLVRLIPPDLRLEKANVRQCGGAFDRRSASMPKRAQKTVDELYGKIGQLAIERDFLARRSGR